MNEILKIVLKITISGTIFFMLFFCMSFITRKIFSAKFHFFILKINMIFYGFPIVLLFRNFNNYSKGITINYFNVAFNKISVKSSILSIAERLFIVWILGTVIFILWNIYCYNKFIKEVISFSYEDNEFSNILNRCKRELDITSKIYVRKSFIANSPMLVGIFNPVIIFPDNMICSDNLEPVIIHELIHLRRRDLLIKFIQILITALNWFNPIIYIMNSNIEKWCEISCDEIVAENMSYSQRKEYGNTVISIIENVSLIPNNLCLYLCSDKKYIKRRLIMMLNVKKTSKFKKVFSGLLILGLVVGTTAISVPATTTDRDNEINLEGKTYEETISIIKDSGMMIDNEINSSSRGAILSIDIETGEVLQHISYYN